MDYLPPAILKYELFTNYYQRQKILSYVRQDTEYDIFYHNRCLYFKVFGFIGYALQ